MLFKYCSKCKKLKPVIEFHKGGYDGYNNWCKDCANERARSYYIGRIDVKEYKKNSLQKI